MFEDKVVVITGAAGGIGSAVARRLRRAGARLVLADVRKKKLLELRDEIKAGGGDVLAVEHDVASPDSWDKLMIVSLRTFHRIDILINNAGVVEPGPAWDIPREEVKRQVSVNLLGTIFGCQAALRVMRRQNGGRIVNIASLGGIVPMPGEAIYCATKCGIRGYSLSLAAELQGTPFSVGVVCPDSVDTPQLAYELQYDGAVMSFIGGPLRPDTVARAILRAAAGRKPEILVPAGTGFVCRAAMAFPKLFFLLLPLLRKIGRRRILKKRFEENGKRAALALGAEPGE
jgi:NAD(P)-dependent dehydrogenase (short-subunit alcohol dehydrogenase family)